MRKRLHAMAESVRRRREPMKTVIAALLGLLVASLFAIAGDWLTVQLGGDAFLREQSSSATIVVLITFLWTAASVVLGGYVVARLHNTRGAVSAYIVLELILGAGMLAEFWRSSAAWYDTVAVLFVIPCALLGASLARPRGLNWSTRATGESGRQ
jgi:predicted anti-sigma-YlaC factor YlaD